MRKSISCIIALICFLLCSKLLDSQSRSHWEIPFKVIDRWILVK